MFDLQPGDVLSYSAGSTQTGPEGFRKVQPDKIGMLGAAGERWPELGEAFADGTVLFINAYPATLGRFTAGISVDTYLSPRVLTRALKLGREAGHPVIMVAQPLFVVDALLRHLAAGHALPQTLMLQVGGYVFPRSLETMLQELLEPHVEQLFIVQYFGAAEVDAGVLMARERNADGELIYYPRPDVEPEVDGEDLLLSLRAPNGALLADRFRTGDLARPCGDGWVIRNPRRLHPDVHRAMESWSAADWRRRTGYLRRDDNRIRIQLRQGEEPANDDELEHFEFARRFGFSWLEKPYWR
ncbi:MAG: hypothetical protein AAF481_20305 [Acidobacteriota bacterium]